MLCSICISFISSCVIPLGGTVLVPHLAQDKKSQFCGVRYPREASGKPCVCLGGSLETR